MSSFPGRALAQPSRPVSAHSGRKEFIEAMSCGVPSGGRSPSRGHGSALMRFAQHSRWRPLMQPSSRHASPSRATFSCRSIGCGGSQPAVLQLSNVRS
jgi:hypothetical protein